MLKNVRILKYIEKMANYQIKQKDYNKFNL